MAYFMLVMGKQGICRGISSWRNNAGWHDVTEINRPLAGSGYRYDGRDELNRKVEVKMVSEPHGRRISGLLERNGVVTWLAIEEAYDGKARSWWTFFDVTAAGYSVGTDHDSPTGNSIAYIFEFRSARTGGGPWPGAVRTQIPRTGLDPSSAVARDTDRAVMNIPVPRYLKEQRY